jgi:hypothetical protein
MRNQRSASTASGDPSLSSTNPDPRMHGRRLQHRRRPAALARPMPGLSYCEHRQVGTNIHPDLTKTEMSSCKLHSY